MKTERESLGLQSVPEYESRTVLRQNMDTVVCEIRDRAKTYRSLSKETYGEQYLVLKAKGDAMYEVIALIMEGMDDGRRDGY